MKSFYTTICLLFTSLLSFGQGQAVGFWNALLPYNSSNGIARNGNIIYVATDIAFFSYDITSGEVITHSKVDGMSDVNTSKVGYDELTETVIIGYQNGNIDLYKDNSFYNLPDLKLKSVNGTKTINHIYTKAGIAYLSTDIGIIVLNLNKREIKETYTFYQNSVALSNHSFTERNNFLYTATNQGLYRASSNAVNLQATSSWKQIGGGRSFLSVVSSNDTVFATTADTVFIVSGDTLMPVLGFDNISGLSIGKDFLFVLHGNQNSAQTFINFDAIKKISLDSLLIKDTLRTYGPKEAIEIDEGSTYAAAYRLIRFYGDWAEEVPMPGPNYYGAFDIYAQNDEVWIAHGAYNDLYQEQYNKNGFSVLRGDKWTHYTYNNFESIQDAVAFEKRPSDKSMWIGSMQTGLTILNEDGTHSRIYSDSVLEYIPSSTSIYPVTSIAADEEGNMWVANSRSAHELKVYTTDGNWYSYAVNFSGDSRSLAHSADHLTIDDAGQKWFHPQNGPSMIIMYNDNNTLANTADDQIRAYTAGAGLPGSKVYSLVKDKDGALWVGTDDGIAVVNSPELATQNNTTIETPVVQYDQFPGKLFQGEQVYTIAVDGANRKWIGTGNGVWLISEDGETIIYRFTVDNSPLPSNRVRTISIDPVTGVVYIGTDNGVVSFRSTATEGGTQNSNVLVFPNPVPSSYSGTIAIKGLVDEADVRITDISGQLVYKTKALGGQAVWNGMDYTGRRPQSGVYLIFATNKDGSETNVSKMVFLE